MRWQDFTHLYRRTHSADMGQPQANAPVECPGIRTSSPQAENPPIGADIFLPAYTAGWDLRQKSSFSRFLRPGAHHHPSALRRLDSADANNRKSWRRDYSGGSKAAEVSQGDDAQCALPVTPPSTPDGTQLCNSDSAEDGDMDDLDAVLSSLLRTSAKDVEAEVEGALRTSPTTCDGHCRPETPPPSHEAEFDLDIDTLPPSAMTTETAESGAEEPTPLPRGSIRKLPDASDATVCRQEGTTRKRARHSDEVKPASILHGMSPAEQSKAIAKHHRPVTRAVAAAATTTTTTKTEKSLLIKVPTSQQTATATSAARVPALPRVSSVKGWGKLTPLAPTLSQAFGGECSLCSQLSLGDLGDPGAIDLTEAQLATIASLQPVQLYL